MKKIALVTGASSGIGKAIAKILAKDYNLIICGRNSENLKELTTQLMLETEVRTLIFDVREKHAVFKAIDELEEAWKNISVVINNAGNAHGLEPLDKGNTEDWDAMIDSNIKGLLYVSKAVIPFLIQNKAGHIINISSTAGKETYENGTVYCASKSAVEEISKGMRLDIGKHGIKVTNLAPGAVETNFSLVRFKGDVERAQKVYEGFKPLTAFDIATTVDFVLSLPQHVLIADITVTPTTQLSATTFVRK
ncbi:MAG: SDR family NAD(P)-dependent oxidoreductase [Solirubrobacteraceae bacterium]